MNEPTVRGKTRQSLVKSPKGHAELFAVHGGATFATWLVEQGYSLRTVELYGLYARRASEHLRAQGRSLSRATEDDVRSFWSSLPTSSSSRNGCRHALIAWYRFRGRRDGGPAHLIERIPAPETLPRPVAELDYNDMLTAARDLGGIWQAFACLIALTGCRMSEASRARWHQFELRGDNPVWYIEGKGSRRRGPKVRQVPLLPDLIRVLREWRAECDSADWLFPSDLSNTGHMNASTLNKRLTEVCEAAAIDRATAHKWRHTVATLAVDRTGNLIGVQQLLGHSNLSTTQIYTKVLPGRLRSVVESLEQRPEEDDVA